MSNQRINVIYDVYASAGKPYSRCKFLKTYSVVRPEKRLKKGLKIDPVSQKGPKMAYFGPKQSPATAIAVSSALKRAENSEIPSCGHFRGSRKCLKWLFLAVLDDRHSLVDSPAYGDRL